MIHLSAPIKYGSNLYLNQPIVRQILFVAFDNPIKIRAKRRSPIFFFFSFLKIEMNPLSRIPVERLWILSFEGRKNRDVEIGRPVKSPERFLFPRFKFKSKYPMKGFHLYFQSGYMALSYHQVFMRLQLKR